MTEPAAAEAVHYEAQIKPLFRGRDQQTMKWAFDLWSYQDVSEHADAILTRLRDGTMPCDGRWPDARVELFDQWIRGGKLS
jgi:hypothetical protein